MSDLIQKLFSIMNKDYMLDQPASSVLEKIDKRIAYAKSIGVEITDKTTLKKLEEQIKMIESKKDG